MNKKQNYWIAMNTAKPFNAPKIMKLKYVTDSVVRDQGRLFKEAVNQTKPLTKPGTFSFYQASSSIKKNTSLKNGLKLSTANRLVTNGGQLKNLLSGANSTGKVAEVVVAADLLDLHAGIGKGPRIVNSPKYVAKNVVDIKLSPDHASKKDLIFQFSTKDGIPITRYNGQVKTGSGQYIARSLSEMAGKPGYGKTGYIDAKFVNRDGTPRVAPNAFTKSQASKLLKAKVRLRGIRDLEARATKLEANIRKNGKDGLTPIRRRQLIERRNDISKTYSLMNTTLRVGGGALMGAASAALVSLLMQIASKEDIELSSIGEVATSGGLFGAGSIAADAAIYNVATSKFGIAPEVAKPIAQHSIATTLCLVSIVSDIVLETKSYRNGEVSLELAVASGSFKTALDLLPIVLAPLGIVGVSLLIVSQLGGRTLISKFCESEKLLEAAIVSEYKKSELLNEKLEWGQKVIHKIKRDNDETDAIYKEAMQF